MTTMRQRIPSTSDKTARWKGDETEGSKPTQQLVALGPMHASLVFLRLLLPLVAIAVAVLSSHEDYHGQRDFWHCVPFATAGVISALAPRLVQSVVGVANEETIDLMSWQIKEVMVPATQLAVLGIAVSIYEVEYDFNNPDYGYNYIAVGLGVVASIIHVLFPCLCSFLGVLDRHTSSPSPRLHRYPIGFPAPGNRCRDVRQTIALASRALSNVAVLPVVDEIFFRSFVDDRLSEYFGWTCGGIATAITWGSLHSGYPFEWIYASCFGLGLQVLVEHPTDNSEIITAAVVAHATRNTILTVYALATKKWHLLEL